jgi:anti-sigma regulatory factor (Ser/Thr protein kinase)
MKYFIRKILEKIFTDYLSKWKIKLILSIGAFGFVIAIILYTQQLADTIIEREQKIIHFYASIYQHYSNVSESYDEYGSEGDENDYYNEDFNFFLDEIIPSISFPMICTGADDEPIFPYEDYTLNIELDSSSSTEEQRQYLKDYVENMRDMYPPIVVLLEEKGIILNKFYYTHSALVDYLRYFPIVAIIIMGAFIFVGYIAFNSIRRNAETKVWVGMAKEAAHQLGTPLSSLMAWTEIIKQNINDAKYIDNTISEMENDLFRLKNIANRFSKIGSTPEKKIENISSLIEKTCTYFERRLPNLGKRVDIIRNLDSEVQVEINYDLFEWVIENLLKNAAESIENKHGKVFVDIHSQAKKITISIKDNGKGMSAQQKRQVFYPGFTTKKRGWGLGLSLAKRIVEEYHSGKIYVKDSTPGKGSTFIIELYLT